MLTAKLAFGLLLGAGSFHLVGSIPSSYWIPIPIMLALLGISHRPTLPLSLPILLGFTWTWWHAATVVHARLPPQGAHRIDVQVVGEVIDFPRHGTERETFILDVSESERPVPKRLRLSWYRDSPGVRLGDRLSLQVRLRDPGGTRNHGLFDYERWLFVQRIGATGYVRRGTVVSRPAGLARYRVRLAQVWQKKGGSAAPLLVALTVGSRHLFSDDHWRVFRQTATSHLVAISGLHIGLAAGLFLGLARMAIICLAPLNIAQRAMEYSAGAAFVGALIYAALAGFGLPTQRALWMLFGALCTLTLRRPFNPLATFSLALIGVLLTDPFAPLRPGFWLSFGAVAVLMSLAAVKPVVPRTNLGCTETLVQSSIRLFRLQFMLTLSMMPVLALSFGVVGPMGLIANLFAIPWFSLLLVPCVLAASVLWLVHPDTGEFCMAGVAKLAELSWGGLTFLADIYPSELFFPSVPAWFAAIVCLASIIYLIPMHHRARWLPWFALIPLLAWHPSRLEYGAFQFELLDVGQGQAGILRTAHHTLIYDAGPAYENGFNAGRDIVVPRLHALGIRSVDRTVISHGDNDHAGGLEALGAAFPRAHMLGGAGVDHPGVLDCERGQTWHRDGVSFLVVHPAKNYETRNDGSCVLKVTGAGGSLLLAGDIQAIAESDLVAEAGDQLKSDVVLVPHHGSDSSSGMRFVDAVQPILALIAVGYGNRWGFPKPEVVDRWRRSGARILTTAHSGAVQVTFPAEGAPYVSRRERQDSRRFWQRDDLPGANPGAGL